MAWPLLLSDSQSPGKVGRLSLIFKFPLSTSPICPVRALQTLLHRYHLPSQAPLFTILAPHGPKTLTQAHARTILAHFCSQLHLPYQALGFHAFRRSGVSFLFSHRVALERLQHHGTWSSSSIYHYLSNSSTSSIVPQAFQTLLS